MRILLLEDEYSLRISIEEFLADGIIILYNLQRGDKRENALEILKMRYSHHQKKIFAMEITNDGIKIYPEKQVVLYEYKQ